MESDVSIRISIAGATIDRVIDHMKIWCLWKIKREFFQAIDMSELMYDCTVTKFLEKKLDACCFEEILEAAPTKQQLYGHLTSISLSIQVRTRPAGDYWWSKD